MCQQGFQHFLSPYSISVCVPARLSVVPVTILHYSVCATKAVFSSCHHTALECACFSKAPSSSCHHTALQCACQEGSLQFLSPFCITVCVCQQGSLQFLSPFCIRVCVCQQGSQQFLSPYCITVCVPARLSSVPVTILHYSVCASKAPCNSCHPTALQCVCQQGCLQFLSLNFITVCVPARLSTFPVTILHYSVCASNAVYSSCHHTTLQCVCQQCCLQSCHHTALQCVCQQCCLESLSPYCITVCVPARLSTFPVTILHYSVCASKAVYSSCHHTALQCVCQQGSLQFLSPYCIRVCVPVRLSTFPVTILHYSVCASKAVYSSCHHTTLQCVCQQGCLQVLSPCCITVCVRARLSTVPFTTLHYSVCASKAVYSSCHQTALQCVCQQGCLQCVAVWLATDDWQLLWMIGVEGFDFTFFFFRILTFC